MQLAEIVTLQDHVVELEERQRLLAIEPQADAVEGQHAVDCEMRADIAQKVDPAEPVEPVRVVRHYRVRRAVAEAEERPERARDTGHVRGDRFIGQHLPAFVLAGRIPDPRRATAHENDRAVPVPLQQPQDHDLHEAADMQAVGRAVEADIGRHRARAQRGVERVGVGRLVDEATLRRFVQEVAGRHRVWSGTGT